MPLSKAQWLDVVTHRVRRIRARYLLVVQHHEIPVATLLVAPNILAVPCDPAMLAPKLSFDGKEFSLHLLDMSPVPRRLLDEAVGSASDVADEIMGALDIILHGDPVGRPR